jgi:hypothetical protein
MATLTVRYRIQAHPGQPAYIIKQLRNGYLITTNRFVRQWNVTTGTFVNGYLAGSSLIKAIDELQGGTLVYMLDTNMNFLRYTTSFPDNILCLRASSDMLYFATGTQTNLFDFWSNTVTGNKLMSFNNNQRVLSMDRYGSTYITGDQGNGINFWEVTQPSTLSSSGIVVTNTLTPVVTLAVLNVTGKCIKIVFLLTLICKLISFFYHKVAFPAQVINPILPGQQLNSNSN